MSKQVEHVDVSIDLEEHLPLHRLMWRLQDVAVVVVVLVILLSLAGLFGDGWLSRRQAAKADTQVSWQRFARYGNEIEMTVEGAVNEIAIPGNYFGHFKLTRIVPQPERQSNRQGKIVFEFASPPPDAVRFYFLPNDAGSTNATVSVNGVAFGIPQFTYP